MREDLSNGRGIFDARNDPHRPLALLAGFDVYIEYPFQALSPGHGCVVLHETLAVYTLASLIATLTSPCWSDQCSMPTIWSEHTMEAGQVDSGFGDQRCQAGNKIQRLKDDMGGAIAKWSLEFISHLAGGGE